MKVFIAGGTGFIGSYLTEALLKVGMTPVVLVRPQHASEVVLPRGCVMKVGDVLERETITAALSGCEAAIYCVGLLKENPFSGITFQKLHVRGLINCVETVKELGIKRFLLISAQGVKLHGTAYQTTKYLGEQYLKQQSFDWTIFRPSLVFGDPRGRKEFTNQLYRQIVRLPVPAPLFFRGFQFKQAGNFTFTPVYVEDLAAVIVSGLNREETYSRIIPVGGPDEFTWKEIIGTIAEAANRKKWTVPIPTWILWPVLIVLERLPFFPLSRDQVTMLLEGNVASHDIFQELNIQPTPFTAESLRLGQNKG